MIPLSFHARYSASEIFGDGFDVGEAVIVDVGEVASVPAGAVRATGVGVLGLAVGGGATLGGRAIVGPLLLRARSVSATSISSMVWLSSWRPRSAARALSSWVERLFSWARTEEALFCGLGTWLWFEDILLCLCVSLVWEKVVYIEFSQLSELRVVSRFSPLDMYI